MGRLKTHAEFVKEVKNRFPTIEILGCYMNSTTPCKTKCQICGNIWNAKPVNLLNSKYGCPKCAGNYQMNQIEFVDKVVNLCNSKNYQFVSHTTNTKNSRIKYICYTHSDLGIQETSYASLIKNQNNCKLCESINQKLNWYNNHPKKEYNKEKFFPIYKEKVKKLCKDEYSLVDIERNNNKIYLTLLHETCGTIFKMEQYHFLKQQNRCPNSTCKSLRHKEMKLKPLQIFKKEFNDIANGEYLVLSHYTGTNNKVTFKHLKCGNIFDMTPHNFINNKQRCPICSHKSAVKKITKTHSEFCSDVYKKYKDEYTIISQYINANSYILIKHNTCGRVSKIKAGKFFINLTPCKYCNNPTRGEQSIINFLDEYLGVNDYEYQKSYNDLVGVNNGLLSYDFYLPTYNMLIEYQGEYHDGSVSCQSEEDILRQQEHDRRKREYAKNHDIKLLEIWYWDFNKINNILTKSLQLEVDSKTLG